MTAADRLDAIERSIPPEAADDPLYADFFRTRDVAALVAALRGVQALDVETVATSLAMSLWSQSYAPRGGLAWHAAEAVVARIEAAITAALTEVTA